MSYITTQGIKELDNYKYVGGEYSWLDKKMNNFWLWCADQLPLTLAPNTVTFIGFIFAVSQYIIMLSYDVTLTRELPNWVFLYAAICNFLYQTLDAVDGKQARRTGTSSPLGQLFDHGCDSFAVTFFLLSVAQSVKMDPQYIFYLLVAVQISVFTANWMEYHVHVLNTQVGNFGVTEAEFIVISIQLISFFCGQSFWLIKLQDVLPNVGISFFNQNNLDFLLQKELYIYIVYFIMVVSSFANLACVFNTIFKQQYDKQKNKIQINKFAAFMQYIPIFCIIMIELNIFQQKQFYSQFSGVILLSFGLLVSLLTCKLIICSLTKMKFPTFHIEIVPYALFCLTNYFFKDFYNLNIQIALFALITILTIAFTFNYTSSVIKQITEHLGIYCFSVQKRKKVQ